MNLAHQDPTYWKHPSGCPRLFLAPMEGLGDGFFRRAITSIGGFDEACTEFIRVPSNAHVLSLAKVYNPLETSPIPQAAQIMGYDPVLVGDMAAELVRRGAPRIDLNCGCPSNTVTGRGAGSSLLRDPSHLGKIVQSIVANVPKSIPVSVKLRSGFKDTSLFTENLLAAEAAGATFLALHPRTKTEGYKPPAHWDLIRLAKETVAIPVIGNGDILSVQDALRMVKETGCDGLMIGRGAVRDPWIFHEIKAFYEGEDSPKSWESTESYLRHFADDLALAELRLRTQTNKLKQILHHLFDRYEGLALVKKELLRQNPSHPAEFLDLILEKYRPYVEQDLSEKRLKRNG